MTVAGALLSKYCSCTLTYECIQCEKKRNTPEKIRKIHKVAPCGTRSGYKRHRANGEPYCDDCRNAQRLGYYTHKARKEARTMITLNLDAEIVRKATLIAEEMDMSLTEYIETYLKWSIAQEEE